MIEFNQESFLGGMSQAVDSTRLDKTQYPLLVNARNRYDLIRPVKLPTLVNDPLLAAAGGNLQGSYDLGNYNIVFKNGKAFYKDENFPSSNYNQIADFQLDPNAPILYAKLVPISSLNFARTPTVADSVRTEVKISGLANASASGLVVQDGVSQPWVINTNLTARELGNYNDWTMADREYVPIGKQMIYVDGILYVVSSDNKQLFRSITGRPLDFMVNIRPDGNKEPLEVNGGAATVSFTVGFDTITCISELPTDDGSFFVSTGSKASYVVTPLVAPEDLIFGEPDYKITFLFSAGAISPFGFIELLGDSAFIDFNGLRSFNSVLQLKNEGKNSPFSKTIGPVLQGVIQDYTAAVEFDNYAFFGVNTIYGRAIVVYDTLSQVFVGLDIYPGVGQIIKFTKVKTIVGTKLFFSDSYNNYYEAFSSDETATAALYIGDWCSNDPNMEQKPWQLKLVFNDCRESGTIVASIFVDKKLGGALSYPLTQVVTIAANAEINPPFGPSNIDTVRVVDLDFTKKGKQGWRVGFYISWNIDATLSHVKFSANEEPSISATTTQAERLASTKSYLNGLLS